MPGSRTMERMHTMSGENSEVSHFFSSGSIEPSIENRSPSRGFSSACYLYGEHTHNLERIFSYVQNYITVEGF